MDSQARISSDPTLTGSERVKVLMRNNFASPGAFFRAVGPAIGSQIGNNPPDWGESAEGYGKRVGLNALMYTSQDFIQAGSAALLGRDPRYQRCECKGVWRRTGHAIGGVFVSADSKGALRFDPSNLIASYASGYIGASMYPDRYSLAVKGSQFGHRLVGSVAINNVFLEFSPELKRFVRRRILRKQP